MADDAAQPNDELQTPLPAGRPANPSLLGDQGGGPPRDASTPSLLGSPTPAAAGPAPSLLGSPDPNAGLLGGGGGAPSLLTPSPDQQSATVDKSASLLEAQGQRVAAARPAGPYDKLITPESIMPRDQGIGIRDVTNFLIGPEMAVVGAKWDQGSFSWNLENMYQQWSEQPVWVNALNTASLVGTIMLPGWRAAQKSLKMGMLASTGLADVAGALPGIGENSILNKMTGLGLGPLRVPMTLAAKTAEVAGRVTPEIAEATGAVDAAKAAEEAARLAPGQNIATDIPRTPTPITASNGLPIVPGSKYFDAVPDRDSEISLLKQLGYIDQYMPNDHELMDWLIQKGRLSVESQDRTRQIMEKVEMLKQGGFWATDKLSNWEKARYSFAYFFGNGYMSRVQELQQSAGLSNGARDRMGQLFNAKDMGTLLQQAAKLDEGQGQAVEDYLLRKYNPELAVGKAPVTLDADSQSWADKIEKVSRELQQEQLASGFTTQDEIDRVGGIHFAMQTKGTPMPNMGARKVPMMIGKDGIRMIELPALDNSKTLAARMNELPDLHQKLLNGQLITDPKEQTFRSYFMDALLHDNFKYIRDIAVNPDYAIPHADIVARYGARPPPDYVWLGNLSGSGQNLPTSIQQRLANMISMVPGSEVLGPNGELPWVRRAVFNELFGSQGMVNQTAAAVHATDYLTAMYKTAKTGLNPATQVNNAIGYVAFQLMAGMNPFSAKGIDLTMKSASMWKQLSAAFKQSKEKDMMAFLDPKNGYLMGLTPITHTDNGITINMTKEFMNPAVQQLFSVNLHNVEGAGHLDNLNRALTNNQPITQAIFKSYFGVKNMLQLGGAVPWWDKMTNIYMAAEAVPKMAYFTWLRARGVPQMQAVIDVARHFPMYNTSGAAVVGARKFWLPWVSFPTEASRIIKNNLMDNPLRMVPWLHAPQILQTLMAEVGAGPASQEETAEAKRGLPTYFQKPNMVVTKGLGGILSGSIPYTAGAGAVAGGALTSSPLGVGVGAGLGAAAGALAGWAGYRPDRDGYRASLLEWLPQSSFLPATTSPDFVWNGLSSIWAYTKLEPAAIMQPIISVIYGQTPWGDPIRTSSMTDTAAKAFAGLVGYLAPPWVQEYGFYMGSPDVGLTSVAKNALTGGGGTSAWDPTNISRLQRDLGLRMDYPGQPPGSPIFDFLYNGIGLWRNHPIDPAYMYKNMSMQRDQFATVRQVKARQLENGVTNGLDGDVKEALGEVMKTYIEEYAGEPGQAQKAYTKWLQGQVKTLGRLPAFRGYSAQDLTYFLQTAGDFAAKTRQEYYDAETDELRKEAQGRYFGTKAGGARGTEGLSFFGGSTSKGEPKGGGFGILTDDKKKTPERGFFGD